MQFKPQLLVALVAAACAVSAHAETTGPGLYIGGSVGQSKWKGDEPPGIDTTKTAGKVYGGYEFSPNFGLELGYVDLGKFTYLGGETKANGAYLDAVGKFPFAPSWSALARAGAFRGKLDNGVRTDTGSSYKVGLGLQYDLTENAAIRGEYERYKFNALDSKPNTDLLTVGVNYRF